MIIHGDGDRTVDVGNSRKLDFALRRAANIHWHHADIDQATRALSLGQTPRCAWFTGLSGSGKSTIANLVEKKLHAMGHHAYILDGDNVRHGLNKDLGFTDEDRVENIRRVAEVARLMVDAGLIVMLPIIFSVAKQFGGSVLKYALPSAGAFAVMHAFLPPHPGPVAAAEAAGLAGAAGTNMQAPASISLKAWLYAPLKALPLEPVQASLLWAMLFNAVMFIVAWTMWKKRWFIKA